jgi:hypothetical protein
LASIAAAGRAGIAEGDVVQPAVEAGGELGDAGAAGDDAGGAAGEMDGLAARVEEDDAAERPEAGGQGFGGLLLQTVGEAGHGAVGQGGGDRLDHRGRGVAEEVGAHAQQVVDVAVALLIPQEGALGAGDAEGDAIQLGHGAAGAGDAADEVGHPGSSLGVSREERKHVLFWKKRTKKLLSFWLQPLPGEAGANG